VFTSGGDAQGMNSALRAITRLALSNNMRAFAIYEGYQGLVDGGDKIMELNWSFVSGIIHKGGTVIGTARCNQFRERSGRLAAAKNLVVKGINNLAVIGGDGSLTGANLFKTEWSGLLKELVDGKSITPEQASCCSYLNIVGLVGSIDNDMCGTDMTIGTDSALHRIIEAVDCLNSTAASHQRSFVLEVMGRHCGYLALMASIAVGADWVLIPESPPKPGWEDVMCEKMSSCRSQGRRNSLVIISEGAVDQANKPITSQYIKEVLEKRLGHDTRITVLGHVQRGGKPSAYDRAIGCRMGAAAALTLIRGAGKEIEPVMIGVQGNQIVEVPLMDCVKKTRAIDKSMTDCKFEDALRLRGSSYQRNLKLFKRLEFCDASSVNTPDSPVSPEKYCFAVMTIGAPAAGMNSCARAFVRLLLYQGHTVLGIMEGFSGLLQDDVHPMTWKEVDGWAMCGGSNLGTNRVVPTDKILPEIAAKFGEYKIQGLLIIGGFEAFESLITLEKSRSVYMAFRIPLLGIAATISNNVPGTETSLGCDTALNTIMSAMDTLKQSAHASRKRVFVIETMGGYCGFLATISCLAGGADAAYIYEDKPTIVDLQRDVNYLVEKFRKRHIRRGMMIRNEKCSENFTTEFLCQLLTEESQDMFVARSLILGHLQQGEYPSPYDRILGVKYASQAVDFLIKHASENTAKGKVCIRSKESACILGVHGKVVKAIPLQDLCPDTDFDHRIPKQQWWMKLRPLISVLAHHKEEQFLGEQQ
jgi:6-phosphofructokinase 1